VTLDIRNADATELDQSIFHFSSQTAFTVSANSLKGTATAKTYNLAVFFMYLNANNGVAYYTNKKTFDVVVTDPCSQQAANAISLAAFSDEKYYFG